MAFSSQEGAEVEESAVEVGIDRGVLSERITFHGHPMVTALHPTTIEITTEDYLSRRGDCIVGVGAERGCAGLGEAVKAAIRRESSQIILHLVVGTQSFAVRARGDPRLTLTHPHDIVVRKSDFISDRTIAVSASHASKDIPRSMVATLRRADTVGYLEVLVS